MTASYALPISRFYAFDTRDLQSRLKQSFVTYKIVSIFNHRPFRLTYIGGAQTIHSGDNDGGVSWFYQLYFLTFLKAPLYEVGTRA